jgi:hypothetical protein
MNHFMVALGIRKLSPPVSQDSWLWLWEPVRRSCVPRSRGTITLVQYAAYFSGFASLSLRRGGFAGGYHSILITLVRVTLHFYSFLRYVGAVFCCEGTLVEFKDTANGLLSIACAMQDLGVEIPLGDHCECQPMYCAHRLLSTSNPPSRGALASAALAPRQREQPHQPLGVQQQRRSNHSGPCYCYRSIV